MKNWHKLVMGYLVIGAGVTAWAYFKGYALSPLYVVTWPTKIGVISAAPSTTGHAQSLG